MPPRTRPLLLALGDGTPATGYGRVLRSLLPSVSRSFRVVHFTADSRDPPAGRGWRVEPNRLAGDLGGVEQLPGLLARYSPRVLWICHDLWLWQALAPAVRAARPRPHVVLFTPLDDLACEADAPTLLAELSHLVLFSEHARRRVQAQLLDSPHGEHAPAISVLPHGVDRRRFRPLRALREPADLKRNRRLARARLFAERPALREGFLILNANRNTPRKRLDLTLAGFARFARSREDAFLVLHTSRRGQAAFDLRALAREHGVGERVVLTDGRLDDHELNYLYNACDVGVNTAAKEGWGLVSLEHAAAGAAQLVPALPSCREIWQDRAGLIELARDEHGCRAPDPGALAALLERLYASPRRLWRATLDAHTRALRPRGSWREIGREWVTILSEAAAGETAGVRRVVARPAGGR